AVAIATWWAVSCAALPAASRPALSAASRAMLSATWLSSSCARNDSGSRGASASTWRAISSLLARTRSATSRRNSASALSTVALIARLICWILSERDILSSPQPCVPTGSSLKAVHYSLATLSCQGGRRRNPLQTRGLVYLRRKGHGTPPGRCGRVAPRSEEAQTPWSRHPGPDEAPTGGSVRRLSRAFF